MSTLKIELTKKDVQEAVAEYVTHHYDFVNYHVNPNDVFIDVGLEYEDRPSGSQYPALKRVVVTVKPQNEPTSTSSFDK